VGVAGTGGTYVSANPNNGLDGGNSTITYNGTTVTAGGGKGGGGKIAVFGNSTGTVGAGGTQSGGDSGSGNGSDGSGGAGGQSYNGGAGAPAPSGTNTPGGIGSSPGGGGGGGQYGDAGGGAVGGNGGDGKVLLTFTLPVITIASNNPNLCVGDLLSVVNPCADATYTWRKNGNVVATGTTYTPTEAGNYTVIASYNYNYSGGSPTIGGGNTTNPSNVLVIKPKSVINSFADTICNNATVTITPIDGVDGTVLAGTTYTWIVVNAGEVHNATSNSGSSFNSGQLVHHTTNMQTAVYQVIPTTEGCSGNPFNISITLRPSDYYSFDTLTVCDNEFPFQYGAITFPENTVTGDYPVHFIPNMYCDSMVMLHLIVNQSYNDTVEIEACRYTIVNYFPVSFTANQDTIVSYLYQSILGCDSLVTLKVKTAYFWSEQTVEICGNEMYYFGNKYLTETGIYFDTLQTAELGCDSVIQLNLIVKPSYFFEEEVDVYGNQMHDWQGRSYQNLPAGQYVVYDSLISILGCDSIYQLTLNVYAQYASYINDTTCLGKPYTQYGFNITPLVTGLWLDTLTFMAQANCDSVIYLTLWVNHTDTTYLTDEICFGETYTQHGFNITPNEIATIYDTLIMQNRLGCDSVLLLTLTVNPYSHNIYEESICLGDRFTLYGFDTIPEHVGMLQLQQTLTSGRGCDSIVLVNLTVNPTYVTNYYDTICQGRNYYKYSFNYADTTFDMVGDFQAVQHLQTITGCDSIRILHLHINPLYSGSYDTIAICASELPIRTGNRILFSPNTYLVNYKTACGCDSTVWLTLQVYPRETLISVAVCAGQSYQSNGFDIPSDSTLTTGYKEYVQYLIGTIGGCDSVVKLQLTINPIYQENIVDTICQGERYNNFGFDTLPNTVGLIEMTQNLTSITGCDSIITLLLTVNQTYITEETAIICSNDIPYLWHGHNYTQSGTYSDPLQTALGCDSVFVLHLIVNNAYHDTTYAAICSSETYRWRDQDYDETGTYNSSNFTTTTGCDSLYTLVLTVNPVFVNIDSVTICSNEHYQWRNHDYTQSGIYYDTLYTIHGCDSIFVLKLRVNPTYFFEEEAYSCDGIAYNWHGKILTVSGIYFDTLQTVLGCDSIYQLTLTVFETREGIELATICQGETYWWNGFPYTRSGEYAITFHDGYCDSTATLLLTVNPIPHTYIHVDICQGQPYEGYGFAVEQEATMLPGTFSLQQLIPTATCDSIVTLVLTVNPVSEITIQDSVWRGYPYLENGFNVSAYQTQEVGDFYYQLTTQNITGCDSIVNLILSVISGTGIYHNDLEKELTLYPNPTTGELRIINHTLQETDNIEIYNMLGQKQPFSIHQGHFFTIDVSHLPAGIYVIKIENYVRKFVKK